MTIHQPTLDFLFGRMFEEISGAYGGIMISIGSKLGLYRAMAGAGPLTSAEVARRSGCAERYVCEWLNAQVAGRCIDYDPASRTYRLTAEQAMLFADEASPYFLPHALQVVASLWADEEKALDAFRTGRGVPWGEHDQRLFCGSAAFFRNGYAASLVQHWLPALTGVVAKLKAGASVADIGCGYGHSTLLMAQAFPESRFLGIDGHRDSIEAARRQAREAGVDGQIRFEMQDAQTLPSESFDLVCFFDCLHDMGHPVAAAQAARRALKPGGTLMLVEPFAHDRVEENISPVGRIFYSASTTLCCAHAISEGGTHVLGAQAGPERLQAVLREAGFGTIRLAAETPFNLIFEASA